MDQRSTAVRRSKRAYRVVTDLPDVLPVTEAELDLLEAVLAGFIAELLDDRTDGLRGGSTVADDAPNDGI